MPRAVNIGTYPPESTVYAAIGSFPPAEEGKPPLHLGLKGFIAKPTQRLYTQWEADQFERGELFQVTYGEVRYCDIFGVPRDLTFCAYAGKEMSKTTQFWGCSAYNHVDSNIKPDAKECAKPADPDHLPEM